MVDVEMWEMPNMISLLAPVALQDKNNFDEYFEHVVSYYASHKFCEE